MGGFQQGQGLDPGSLNLEAITPPAELPIYPYSTCKYSVHRDDSVVEL